MSFSGLYFLIGLLIGMCIVYAIVDKPKIVVKKPNDKNISNTSYIDGNKVCYKYEKQFISCPNKKY